MTWSAHHIWIIRVANSGIDFLESRNFPDSKIKIELSNNIWTSWKIADCPWSCIPLQIRILDLRNFLRFANICLLSLRKPAHFVVRQVVRQLLVNNRQPTGSRQVIWNWARWKWSSKMCALWDIFDGAIKLEVSSLEFNLFPTSFIVNTNCYSLDFGVHINLEVTTYSRVEWILK